MLDLIKRALDKNNIASCRIEGSMNRVQRSDTIDRFQNDPHLTVILVSLMAGGVGYLPMHRRLPTRETIADSPSINLTSASRVHMVEPHWNPMCEQQAVERVYRLVIPFQSVRRYFLLSLWLMAVTGLGQKREVVITRYIMKDSFEMVNRPAIE
jgi:SWI/SNF-related matrix-associated actin-dependent regulator of chromatin subfamily A3